MTTRPTLLRPETEPDVQPMASSQELIDLDLAEAENVPAVPTKSSFSALETVLVMATNLVWSVVGVILWLPFLLRTVVVASFATVHSALTAQAHATGRYIRGASGFYREGFVRLKDGDTSQTFRQREGRPVRFFAELAWACLFYTVLLRALGFVEVSLAEMLSGVAERLGPAGAWLVPRLQNLAEWGSSWLAASWTSSSVWLVTKGWQTQASLAGALLFGLALGLFVVPRLVRRRR